MIDAPTESHRVAQLPRIDLLANGLELAGIWTSKLRKAHGTWHLTPAQGAACEAMHRARGLLGALGCGHGKTLIGLLAGTVMQAQHVIYLAPSVLCGNVQAAARAMAEHWWLTTVDVISYERLSAPDGNQEGDTVLERAIAPYDPARVVIVCDEAHRLKNRDSARTGRVLRFSRRHPSVRWVMLSGTMTTRSLEDFGHLAELALRGGSPLPRDRTHLASWARCVDHRPDQPADRADHARINLLQRAMADHDLAWPDAREAVGRRMAATLGVITTGDASCRSSLRIEVRKLTPPDPVVELLEQLQRDGTLPDGDPPQNVEAQMQAARRLACGFYYRWVWPDGKVDHDWLDARRAWAWWTRTVLEKHARDGFDSPALVEQSVRSRMESDPDGQPQQLLRAWDAVRHRPEPPVECRWVDDWYVRRVLHEVQQAITSGRPTLVWYESSAMADALERAGMDVYRAGEAVPEDVARTCAVSTVVHSDGANLQAWSRSLVVEVPSSAKRWEQLLSRSHRQGQQVDEVICEVLLAGWPMERAWSSARANARFIRATTNNPQRLLFADVVHG